MKRNGIFFWIGAVIFLVVIALMTELIRNEYPFFAGYVILQFIVLAVAWMELRHAPVRLEGEMGIEPVVPEGDTEAASREKADSR